MPSEIAQTLPPAAACPDARMLARRVLASRGLSPLGAEDPVGQAVALLSREAKARAAAAWGGIATAVGLVLAATLLLASTVLRNGLDPASLGLELLAALGATGWGFALLGAAADRHGRVAALRGALRRSGGLVHAFRVGILLGAPAPRPA